MALPGLEVTFRKEVGGLLMKVTTHSRQTPQIHSVQAKHSFSGQDRLQLAQ